MDNPFNEASRSHRLFEVLANADRPLSPVKLARAVGQRDPTVAHSMLRDLRSRGITVYRYRDPKGARPTASVYSLQPVDGLDELAAPARQRGHRPGAGPPTPIRPAVRQPVVGSVARIIAVALDGDEVQASFDCEGITYRGTVKAAQPTVGEWMTFVTVGLHGHGLYVDLAGARVLTLENIMEVHDDGHQPAAGTT